MFALAAGPPATQDWVDLARYAGRWYEIARLPNRFQDRCAGDVSATYTLRDDGRFAVLNECRKANGSMARAEGLARRAEQAGPPSRLKVRFAPAWLSFLPQVWGDYWILELHPDYRHALVGDPARRYLWILSRTPDLDAADYASLVAAAEAKGFEVAALRRTPQSASPRNHGR